MAQFLFIYLFIEYSCTVIEYLQGTRGKGGAILTPLHNNCILLIDVMFYVINFLLKIGGLDSHQLSSWYGKCRD